MDALATGDGDLSGRSNHIHTADDLKQKYSKHYWRGKNAKAGKYPTFQRSEITVVNGSKFKLRYNIPPPHIFIKYHSMTLI